MFEAHRVTLVFWESHKTGTLKLGFPRLLAEVSLPGGGIGGFGCGGTRTPDSDCPRPSTISEETKDSSLRSREQVKARRGGTGSVGQTKGCEGSQEGEEGKWSDGRGAPSRDCGPVSCPQSPFMGLWILQTVNAVASGG